jgi:hypothetical protein
MVYDAKENSPLFGGETNGGLIHGLLMARMVTAITQDLQPKASFYDL